MRVIAIFVRPSKFEKIAEERNQVATMIVQRLLKDDKPLASPVARRAQIRKAAR